MKSKTEREQYRKEVFPQDVVDHTPELPDADTDRIPQDWENFDGGGIDSHYSPIRRKN